MWVGIKVFNVLFVKNKKVSLRYWVLYNSLFENLDNNHWLMVSSLLTLGD